MSILETLFHLMRFYFEWHATIYRNTHFHLCLYKMNYCSHWFENLLMAKWMWKVKAIGEDVRQAAATTTDRCNQTNMESSFSQVQLFSFVQEKRLKCLRWKLFGVTEFIWLKSRQVKNKRSLQVQNEQQ